MRGKDTVSAAVTGPAAGPVAGPKGSSTSPSFHLFLWMQPILV